MDNNYWYYTLSAIPQTLATMIALSATFSVVKLDSLFKKLKDSRVELRRFMLLMSSVFEATEREIHTIEPLSDREFFEKFKEYLSNLDPQKPNLGLGDEKFKKCQQEMYRIINSEWRSYYGAGSARIYGYLEMKKNYLRDLLNKKDRIIFLIKCGLFLISFVIIAALIFLPSYRFFSGSPLLVGGLVFSAILSVIVTALGVFEITSK